MSLPTGETRPPYPVTLEPGPFPVQPSQPATGGVAPGPPYPPLSVPVSLSSPNFKTKTVTIGTPNPNWARWVFASLATLMKGVAKANKIPCLVEGLDERTTEFMDSTDRVEIRITGPFTRDLSVTTAYYELSVDMIALFVSRYEAGKNNYAILAVIGAFQTAMDAPIPIFQYGDLPGDDETVCIGVMEPRNRRGDAVRVMHFGQADLTNRVKQSLVDARYLLFLTNDGQPYV